MSDMLLVRIVWNGSGGIFLIPLDVQREVFSRLGREAYLRKPKRGTNPRGVEISRLALRTMLAYWERIYKIDIGWSRGQTFDPYRRWLEYWER